MSALDQVLSIPSVKAEHPNLHADATDEIATLRAQLAEAQKYPELRCNHCDKVLTATWIDDALGRFALIDKCYCG